MTATLFVRLAIWLWAASRVVAVIFDVPVRAGAQGLKYSRLDPAPVGMSIEFFAFPTYFLHIPATFKCLGNWKLLTGIDPPIRIGGTTQDWAFYDEDLATHVNYTVAKPTDAPRSLRFGPSFMELAGTYKGSIVLGLNRGQNHMSNTIAAAKRALVAMKSNLLAIELGNEPEFWKPGKNSMDSDKWTPAADAASQNLWDLRVSHALSKNNIIQAGNWFQSPPKWGAAQLIATRDEAIRDTVRDYAHHNYPGGSVQKLMDHATTVANIAQYAADVAAVKRVGKEYVMGETNSVAGGGAAHVSPTFGASLWTMDYAVRLAYANISRFYFHQGTPGACEYCFYGIHDMGAPYYGAYVAVAFMAKAATVTALDNGKTNYAAYATFDSDGAPLRVLLYNSDYYDGHGTISAKSVEFTLTGLTATKLKAKRLTAASALTRADQSDSLSFGGQFFENRTCSVSGTEKFEESIVTQGRATFKLRATEALLVYLQ